MTVPLCESTGLGPSSLYNTFGGKRQSYLRALRRYYETSTAEQVAILRGEGFDRVEEELRTVVTAGRHTGELRSTADARTVARRVQSTYYGLRVLARVQGDRQALLGTVESALTDL